MARGRADVLFEVGGTENSRYALVHLTWSGKIDLHTDFPETQFFHSFADWIEWMRRDHQDYAYGEQIADR